MRLPFLPILLLLLSGIESQPGLAQGNSPEAGLKAVQLYNKTIQNQSHLYNGTDFKVFPEGENEHPYFLSNEFSAGNIVYQGQPYAHVELMYNLVTDEVIIEDGATRYNIELIQEGISSFSVPGHSFEKLNEPKSGLPSGFYDVLTSGPTKVFVRHEKSLQHKLRADVLQPWYQVKDRIFIKKGNQYFPITSKKALFTCFADKKDAVKQNLRQQKLRFNAAREQTCKAAATFYDSTQP